MIERPTPPIGLGTAGVDDPSLLATAIEAGYRFIDTAQRYGNEAAVGETIRRSAVDRDDILLSTKVHERNLSYDDVLSSTEESRDRLGVDHIDLLYVHWPLAAYDPPETFRAFDELYDRGHIRHVGLSNFTISMVEEAREHLDAPITALQVEYHPLMPQPELRGYAARHGMLVVGFGPLMVGEVFEVTEIVAVAEHHGVSPAQVSLAWILDNDVIPIPRGDTVDHIHDNLAATGLELSEVEIDRLDNIGRTQRVYPNEAVWPTE